MCFSKNPVPTCQDRHHDYGVDYQSGKKVVYCCLPRDDPQTTRLLRKVIKYRESPSEISSLPTSFTETESIPRSCRRF